MTTPHMLLAAIRSAPADDVPRLAFADWCDDYGRDDWHRATAEFARLTCRSNGRFTATAGRWLDGNWTRLLPIYTGTHPMLKWERSGRWVHFTNRQPGDDDEPGYWQQPAWWMRAEFHRGFLTRAEFRTGWQRLWQTAPSIAAEQPLAAFDTSSEPVLDIVTAEDGTVYHRYVLGGGLYWEAFTGGLLPAPDGLTVVRNDYHFALIGPPTDMFTAGQVALEARDYRSRTLTAWARAAAERIRAGEPV